MKIGQIVTLVKDIEDKELSYSLKTGDTGKVANIIELPTQTLIIFEPTAFNEKLYAIDIKSVV